MSAAIVRDGAEAVGGQEEELLVPRVAVERPAVAEHDGLSLAPVLEEDLRPVTRLDRAHDRHLEIGPAGMAEPAEGLTPGARPCHPPFSSPATIGPDRPRWKRRSARNGRERPQHGTSQTPESRRERRRACARLERRERRRAADA